MPELYISLSETELRAAHSNLHSGRFTPALANRGASGVPAESIFGGVKMRSRKLDEKLSKHGLGARRVALLAPRAMLSLYWSPLDYVSARLKPFSRGVFIKAQSVPL